MWFSLVMPAADVTGIWMGRITAAHEEKQDVAFQFKSFQNAIAGTMFGDEFDVPVQDLKVTGDRVEFTVTTTNYYNGEKVKFAFIGTLSEKEMRLVRERVDAPAIEKSAKEKEKDPKQAFILKRLS